MPKYFSFKVAGYFLYFTSKCIVEAFHVHASDSKLTEGSSAKFFVHEDGSTDVVSKGSLSDHEIAVIRKFIAERYMEMYIFWSGFGGGEFYRGKGE